MNTVENFHIYEETVKNNQINDRHAVKRYVIFETLLKASSHSGRPTVNPRTSQRRSQFQPAFQLIYNSEGTRRRPQPAFKTFLN